MHDVMRENADRIAAAFPRFSELVHELRCERGVVARPGASTNR